MNEEKWRNIWNNFGTDDPEKNTVEAEISALRKHLEPLGIGIRKDQGLGYTLAGINPNLFGESSETVERRILGDTFEYQDQVRKFIESMTWYSDLTLLLNDLHELFIRAFQLESYHIILRDETNRLFEITRSHPASSPVRCPDLRPQSPVFRYFEWTNGEYLPLDADDLYTRSSQLARQSREQLAPFDARYCFPLASEGEIFGLLLVGDKMAEQFTANDISLLITLVKSMSLMVNQIRLKTQILHSQELDLLGKMSRGMAHDLNNLLTPVWTLLQISSETGHTQPLDSELLPVALRNVQTMSAYIKEALFFSENLRPDLQLGRLDVVVRQAASVASASRKKDVQVNVAVPGEELVEMDEVLMQRLVANLISNAIDASRSGTQVRVELERLGKTDANARLAAGEGHRSGRRHPERKPQPHPHSLFHDQESRRRKSRVWTRTGHLPEDSKFARRATFHCKSAKKRAQQCKSICRAVKSSK